MFSTVFQDFNIYTCSVIENVIGNDNEISQIEFGKKCIELVELKEKIESLPNKMVLEERTVS